MLVSLAALVALAYAEESVEGDWTRLWYFTGRGRAEAIRLALTASDTLFAEVQLGKDEAGNWVMDPKVEGAQLPEFFPYRQVPVYEEHIGGEYLKIAQSNAILRHLARRFDLYGHSHLVYSYVDELLQACEDVRAHLRKIFYPTATDPHERLAEQKTAMMAFREGSFTKFVGGIAERLYDIDSSLVHSREPPFPRFGHAVDRTLTVADFALASTLESVALAEPNLFTRIPTLACIFSGLYSEHKLLSYLQDPHRAKIRTPMVGIVDGENAGAWERALSIIDPWALLEERAGFPGSSGMPFQIKEVREWVEEVKRLKARVPVEDRAGLAGRVDHASTAEGRAYGEARERGAAFADAVCTKTLSDVGHITMRGSDDAELSELLYDEAAQIRFVEKMQSGEEVVPTRRRFDGLEEDEL